MSAVAQNPWRGKITLTFLGPRFAGAFFMSYFSFLFFVFCSGVCSAFSVDEEAVILQKLNAFDSYSQYSFFVFCVILGSVLYIAYMQKR